MITILSCTNRKLSLTSKISEYYYNTLLNRINRKIQIINLEELPIDALESILYHNNGKNISFNKIKEKIQFSDKFIFIVPEYNNSFPGVLKIFLEGLSYPSELKNKKCALVGVSSGSQGCELGLSHLTDILNYLGAIVFPLKLKLSKLKNEDLDDLMKNDTYLKNIDKQLHEFISF